MPTILKKTELQDIINKKGKIIIIDVREPGEFNEGSVPSSLNLPVSEIEDALQKTDAEFEKKYGFKKPTKSDDIVMYCRAGTRSKRAIMVAEKLGYGNLKDYSGGWMDWSQ
jgi:thiosulfate:glutathione sulfurtransferase